MKYLIDTNVLSEPAKRSGNPAITEWLDRLEPLNATTSVIVLGEIEHGIELLPSGAARARLMQWLRHDVPRYLAGGVLDVDQHVARTWGRISARARLAGRPLQMSDGLLVATAQTHGLVLATRNVRDCAGLGAPVYDPWSGTLHPG